ncbi:MAG: hypothetical protein RLN75_05830 [Longimicrobiales bacterium]
MTNGIRDAASGPGEFPHTSAPATEQEAEERIDDALRMTFPASDPPAWAGGGPRPAPTGDDSDDRRRPIHEIENP